MPVEPGGTIDPAATRQKVLDAATELFYERGVHAVGVNDIAARAQASKLSIYRYFESKDGLVEAVLAARSQRTYQWLVERTAAAPDGRARVLAVFEALPEWFQRFGTRGCGVVNTVSDTRGDRRVDFSPEHAPDEIVRLAQLHLERYRDLLATHLTLAGAADPAGLARQLVLLVEGATVVNSIDRASALDAAADARAAAVALLAAALPPETAPSGGQAGPGGQAR